MNLEKNTFRTAALIPVFCEEIQILLGKDCEPINSPFRFTDMNSHVGAGNIIIVEMDYLGYTQARRIHGCNDGFMLEILCCINDRIYLLMGKNRRKSAFPLHCRDIIIVPMHPQHSFVKNLIAER